MRLKTFDGSSSQHQVLWSHFWTSEWRSYGGPEVQITFKNLFAYSNVERWLRQKIALEFYGHSRCWSSMNSQLIIYRTLGRTSLLILLLFPPRQNHWQWVKSQVRLCPKVPTSSGLFLFFIFHFILFSQSFFFLSFFVLFLVFLFQLWFLFICFVFCFAFLNCDFFF